MEYENGNAADISVGIITPLRTYDDFRSPEGVNLMEQADIICANPPFSLFYEYVAQLTAYGFIINLLLSIGNLNAGQNRNVFPYILDGRVWMGTTCFNSGATLVIIYLHKRM